MQTQYPALDAFLGQQFSCLVSGSHSFATGEKAQIGAFADQRRSAEFKARIWPRQVRHPLLPKAQVNRLAGSGRCLDRGTSLEIISWRHDDNVMNGAQNRVIV